MLLGVGAVRGVRGQAHERFDTAQAHSIHEDWQGAGEGLRVAAVLEQQREDGADSAGLAGLHLRLFCGGATGVENLLDLGALGEELDNLAGVLLLTFQAQRQGLHVLQQAVGVNRGQQRAADELTAVQQNRQVGVVRRRNTGEQVCVAGKELGGGLHGDVRAELQGTLQVGGHEGVVHDQQGTVAVRQLRDCGNVGDLQGGVRGGLEEDDLHVRGEVLIAQGREVANEAGLHGALSQLGGRKAVRAAVGRHAQQQGVARLQNAECRRGCRHAGGVRVSVLGTLEGGEGRLQVIAGGVRAALVHVGSVLTGGTEGARQVDRRHGRIVAGIMHGVDGAGRETGRFELILLAHGGSPPFGLPRTRV